MNTKDQAIIKVMLKGKKDMVTIVIYKRITDLNSEIYKEYKKEIEELLKKGFTKKIFLPPHCFE